MKTSSVLLILLLIITFPVWIGLIGGLFGMTVGLLGGLFGMLMGLFGAIIGVMASFFDFIFNGFHGYHGLQFFSHPGIWISCLVVAVIIVLSVDRKRKK